MTGGLLAAWPWLLEDLGRLLVVFIFNEALANGMAYLTKGRLLKAGKAHL